jgi:spectinomycin phosphotransferase
MREPPKLAESTLIEALHTHYDLSIRTLSFLPLGADSGSAVYRVRAVDDTIYLLKTRTSADFSIPSLAIPHYLHDQGVPHIAAPLQTITQALWVSLDEFALSLYPFIDGRTGTETGLSELHWRALSTTLKQIHTSQLTPDLERIVRRENYVPSRRDVIGALEDVIARQYLSNPAERELAAFWRAQREKIDMLVERADAFGGQLRQVSLPFVLCHADLHTWNVLLDTTGQMWIVDWDETVLAPKERDLMFVVGGIGRGLVSPRETVCFFEGYGESTIDPLALTYYRYAWAVQDMVAYGERVFFLPGLGEESRRDAVHGFVDMFESGNIVDIALGSDSIR